MREELNYILMRINVDDLRKIASKLSLERLGRKQELIDRIINFYDKENFVINIYNELNAYEKEYIDTVVKQRYIPLNKSLNEIHEKYKNSMLKLNKVYYFYIDDIIPKFIRQELDKLVPPYEITYKKTEDKIDFNEHYDIIEIEDKSVTYCDEFIKYINEYKIKLTDKKHEMSKKDCLKFIDICKIKEVSKRIHEGIKNIDDTVIMKCITDLLVSAKVINNTKDIYTLGSNYKKYLKLNKIEKAKLLLNSYLKSNSINEIERMRSGIYKCDFKDFTYIRYFILDALKKLPINEWVSSGAFIEQIRMKDGNFIRHHLGEVTKKEEYYNWFYNCNYEEFDFPLINVCLMEFFAPLGIIDVIIDTDSDDRCWREFLTNSYIKLTNFGAQILGLEKVSNELIINSIPLKMVDNKIIIYDDTSSMEHILFFDRFLTKEKENGNIIYNLDFKGIAKALDIGITLEEIFDYLKNNIANLSPNIVNNFNYYKSVLNKVKIKEVTVLEYPKEFASIISNIKKVNNSVCKTKEILIIDKKKKKEVKTALENNNLFCTIE